MRSVKKLFEAQFQDIGSMSNTPVKKQKAPLQQDDGGAAIDILSDLSDIVNETNRQKIQSRLATWFQTYRDGIGQVLGVESKFTDSDT